MPGGVNSPVRAFKAVGGTPLYISKAKGPFLTDADGKEYVDFISSWGAIILGHADAETTTSITAAAELGTSYGASHEGELKLARELISRFPAVERVRFVNSGTEAAMAAVRLVRAFTGRDKLIKFEGNYHGAIDSLLAKAGSGVATFGLPDSAGVTQSAAGVTLTARYNDAGDVKRLLEANPGEIAAVLLEPVAGNMGLVPPKPEFLAQLRSLCDEHGALLVVDEVMTGLRVAKGGATERFGLKPDLVLMGKVIGGGLPVGAYGGRIELMEMIAPVGPVYQAGTLSGNPLAMAAGYSVVSRLDHNVYDRLESLGKRLGDGLTTLFGEASIPVQVQRVGSMISVFFSESPVENFAEAKQSNTAQFSTFFHALLAEAIYLPPSALESWFITLAHDEAVIDRSLEGFRRAIKKVGV